MLTVAFRFIGGVILGCLLGVLIGYRPMLRSFSRNHIAPPIIFLAVCGLGGGIVAACKTPYWQTLWYKAIEGDRENQR
jgi:hypothetical protein